MVLSHLIPLFLYNGVGLSHLVIALILDLAYQPFILLLQTQQVLVDVFHCLLVLVLPLQQDFFLIDGFKGCPLLRVVLLG
mmetsp:Transcript_44904/g.43480  ORF Transcript_44904/g.43480 Transcript_44904/m.43480 type:complete len:80 (-) Transcript_44904:873-1112(-)